MSAQLFISAHIAMVGLVSDKKGKVTSTSQFLKRIREDRKYSTDIFGINFRNKGWKGTIDHEVRLQLGIALSDNVANFRMFVFLCFQLSHWYSWWNWTWNVCHFYHSDQRKLDSYESRNRLLGEEIWVLTGVKYFHLVDKAIRKTVKENCLLRKKINFFRSTSFFCW